MNKQLLIKWLLKTDIPLTTISKKTNISRKTIYNWINGGEIRKKSYRKIYNVYKEEIELINNNIPIEGGDTKVDAQYIIDLQKDKIQALEKDVFKLKELLENKTPESTHWDELIYDFSTDVTLHFSSFGIMGRTINAVTNISKQAKLLGYSENKILQMWDIGTKYKNMKDHPINIILHHSTTDELNTIGKTLPTVFNAIKDMIGNHYIPTKLMYICKDGSLLGGISYNKIDWKNQKVWSKIAFLIDR
tara:strand:+ start:196 stop:936 length:741 start_codon:yes stop_codon:yes gene_type:complete